MRLGKAGLALALGLGAWIRWVEPECAADLQFRPDALEYEEAARNLARGEGYCLVLEGGKFPPRYPFGFSGLLAPFLGAFGDEFGSGIRVVLATAVAAIAGAWALGKGTGGPTAAVGSALLLALVPLHVRWSKSVMSDVPATAAVVGLALWTLSALRRGARAREIFALGLVSGLGATVRYTNLLLLVPTAVALAASGGGRGERLRRPAALVAGAAAGLVPLLVYHASQFGSPLATGYAFWDPFYKDGKPLAWAYAVEGPRGGRGGPNLLAYALALVGWGGDNLYPWPIALLVIGGAFLALRSPGPTRAFAWIGLGFAALLFGFHALYFIQDPRFLLPALPLLLVLASLPFSPAAPAAARAGAGALLLGAILAGRKEFTAVLPPTAGTFPYEIAEVRTLRDIGGRVEPNAALLLRTNVFFFRRILREGTDRIWVPLDFCEHRQRVRLYDLHPYAPAEPDAAWIRDAVHQPFNAERASGAIEALLREGRPVYFSLLLVIRPDVPFAEEFQQWIGSRFQLEHVPTAAPWGLFRVRERG